MRYVPPVLMRYRYPILALLSLLLIVEVVVTSIDTVPIEYEWVLGWLLFLTVLAWAGIAGTIGVGAPVGEYVLKRPARILILPPVLFVMFILSPLFEAILFSSNDLQSVLLDELIWQPYSILFLMVWAGIVVIFGATIPDIEHRSSFKETLDMSVVLRITLDVERSRRLYLRMGVFPLLMFACVGLFGTAALLMDPVLDLLDRLVGIELINDLIIPLGALCIILPSSLVIEAVIRRSMLVDRPRIVTAISALGISVAAFVFVVVIGLFLFAFGTGSSADAPGVALFLFVVMPVLLSLTVCVFGTVLIGTMRRPVRNVTVAGVGMVAMTQVLVWYLLFSGIWVIAY